uniref:Uncharacterized protein n=1 Tax=Utricularia reniformis TaxID=192314 RepID=A0A1Y0B3S2_9LAMI|nr:hypothetical protein AEK19_MT1904 [Utricularia reniformis]ART32072.1 hypothetical protein AEK19_MT1904 [Utricularia reniformis]
MVTDCPIECGRLIILYAETDSNSKAKSGHPLVIQTPSASTSEIDLFLSGLRLPVSGDKSTTKTKANTSSM